jgi:hypothetical protein
MTMVIVVVLLLLSLIFNFLLICRLADADAEFYLDKSDPDNIKPVLRFNLDKIEDRPYFVVKVIKDKDSGDKN